MSNTRNLSTRQRKIFRSILERARARGFEFKPNKDAAGTDRTGRIFRDFGCAVDAGTLGLRRLDRDPANMRTFARRYETSQAFAMGVSDGFEGYDNSLWTLRTIWSSYGYTGYPSGTTRDYRAGVNVGRAVRSAAAV